MHPVFTDTAQTTAIRPWSAVLAAAAFWLAAMGGVAAQTQSVSERFVSLWTDFINLCGPVLADPASVQATQSTFPNYEHSIWHVAPGGVEFSAEHGDETFNRSMGYHLFRGETSYSLFCEAHRFEEDLSVSTGGAAAQILELLEGTDAISVAGGQVSVLPGSSSMLTNMSGEPYYSFVVDGIFPDFEHAPSQVFISDGELAITLQVSWEHSE